MAVAKLQEALSGPFWIDASHPATKDGGVYRDGVRVFELSREAADKYAGLIGDSKAAVDKARLRELGASLTRANRLLAATAIADAQFAAAAVKATKLEQARKQLAEGDQQATAGQQTIAIIRYRDAWGYANQAMGKR